MNTRSQKTVRSSGRKGQVSKDNILRAAQEVFSEGGYGRASMREVARRAGLSVGCLYLYFPNKQELYLTLMKKQVDEFLARVESLREEEPLAALRGLIRHYMETAVASSKMLSAGLKEYDLKFKAPLRSAFFKRQQALVADIIARGIREGVFRRVNSSDAALVIITSLRGALLAYLTGEVAQPSHYGNKLFTILVSGIRSGKP